MKGITYVGPLPAALQNITTYAIGVHPAAPSAEAAAALVKFLTAPAARGAIEKAGLDPV
jgi:molybdate transport system substrate-binding protein